MRIKEIKYHETGAIVLSFPVRLEEATELRQLFTAAKDGDTIDVTTFGDSRRWRLVSDWEPNA